MKKHNKRKGCLIISLVIILTPIILLGIFIYSIRDIPFDSGDYTFDNTDLEHLKGNIERNLDIKIQDCELIFGRFYDVGPDYVIFAVLKIKDDNFLQQIITNEKWSIGEIDIDGTDIDTTDYTPYGSHGEDMAAHTGKPINISDNTYEYCKPYDETSNCIIHATYDIDNKMLYFEYVDF